MARSVIMASVFAVGVHAARLASTNVEHESQAAAHASDFAPGQLLLPWLESATMLGVPAVVPSVRLGRAARVNARISALPRQGFSRNRSLPLMAMQEPGYRPDLPDDWKSAYDDLGSSVVRLNNLGESVDRLNRDIPQALLKQLTAWVDNTVEAIDSLNRDIPQALRLESDSQRLAPTNWAIYTDSFETDFKTADPTALGLDPTALGLLEALIPSWSSNIKGLRANQRILQELRTLLTTLRFNRVLVSDDVTVSTHMGIDLSTGEDIIESRWIAKLVMKNLPTLPLLPPPLFGQTKPRAPESIVNIEAVSRFYLSAEGRIYRQSIDIYSVLVDEKRVDSPRLAQLLDLLIGLPVPRLPLPPDVFRG